MNPLRIDYTQAAPDAFKAMLALEAAVHRSGLEHSLIELVKMRVSQINGCPYCLEMHSKDACAAGETEQRLHLLAAWREAPCYNQRERAALAWAETLTLVSAQVAHTKYKHPLAEVVAVSGHCAVNCKHTKIVRIIVKIFMIINLY